MQQIGDVGYRRPDGSVSRWEPIYAQEDVAAAETVAADADMAARAARIFAAKYRAYIGAKSPEGINPPPSAASE